MKVRIVRIGNSQGIRIPKLLLEQTGLRDEVELEVREGSLVLRAPSALGIAAPSPDRPYPLAGLLASDISFVGEAVPQRQGDDLAGLLERALRGEDVVVERGGRPVARLVPLAAEPRHPGRLKGKIRIAPDFDAPLPPGLAAAFRGEGA